MSCILPEGKAYQKLHHYYVYSNSEIKLLAERDNPLSAGFAKLFPVVAS